MSEDDDDRGLVSHPESGGKLLSWLNHIYDNMIAGGLGIPGIKDGGLRPSSAAEAEREIAKAIRYATIEAGGVGFLTSVGGAITLPVALPAAIAGTLLIQMRMVARIAHLRGYDVHDPAVRTTVLLCLIGSSISEIVKDAGVMVAGKLGASALKRLPGEVLLQINRLVGFRLLTKFGTKGVVNLTRLVPLAGGAVVAAVDATGTQVVAKAAKRLLPAVDPAPPVDTGP